MAADMVADEMRGYAPPMVDDRWAVQVSALGAEVWWGSDAEFLSARTGDPLRVAIELLHLLQHVPVLERLCPLPGTARAGAWAAGSGADARILARSARCWRRRSPGMSRVVGFPSALDAVELLFTSLLVQANTAMLREGAKKDAYGRSRTRAFRQSFLVAYAYRIGVRLSQATVHAEQEAAAAVPAKDLVPVLKERHEAVDHAVDEMFGDGLVDDRGSRATDEEGWASGLAAADMAPLV